MGSVQFSSVTQLCQTLRDPMVCSTPGFPVHHQLTKHSNSCPSSQWCSTISSSVVPFSTCLQSFPASKSFPMSHFFPSGGQSIGVSASASVLPMNIQDGFHLGWTGFISFQSKRLSRVFSTLYKSINSLVISFLYGSNLTSIHAYWKKNRNFDYMDICR